ncbi:fibrillin-2-like [Prorops nasuta]|uniref:fibrillin-2-like n=1 Tax=Prorops nasuta TaxID=863751 RepID=UPI0034CDE951
MRCRMGWRREGKVEEGARAEENQLGRRNYHAPRLFLSALRFNHRKTIFQIRRNMCRSRHCILWTLVLLQTGWVMSQMKDQFEKCCKLGTSWATEGLRCEKFSGPVSGVPRVEQGLCLEAVDICCTKAYREQQCKRGKDDARAGLDCTSLGNNNNNKSNATNSFNRFRNSDRGDYHRDCCEGCKLGILTGAMGRGCSFSFNFGSPWDPAFLECCKEALPTTLSTAEYSSSSEDFSSTGTSSSSSSTYSPDSSPSSLSSPESSSSSQFPSASSEYSSASSPYSSSSTTISDFPSDATSYSPSIPTPLIDDICQLMKGLLCADICIPTQGSYHCACREGFELLEDGKTCRQKSRTTLDSSNTPSFSNSSPDGDSQARCPSGYKYNAASQVCDDMDECADESEKEICGSGYCANTIGSYVCMEPAKKKDHFRSRYSEECPPGYEWSRIVIACTDIDECVVMPKVCRGEKEVCVNTQGSFKCMTMKGAKNCPAGFKFNSTIHACQDVDECVENIDGCSENERCRNTDGAYECDVICEQGFAYDRKSGICEDINECALGPQVCKSGEHCMNVEGSYKCERPMVLVKSTDGRMTSSMNSPNETSLIATVRPEVDNNVESEINTRSVEKYPIYNEDLDSCRSGYHLVNGQCVDKDECNEGPKCREHERCTNTPGSYKCTDICTSGWYFNLLTKGCQDVNECHLGRHSCPQTHTCVNTPGSFECQILLDCPKGFEREKRYDGTIGNCLDIDECEEKLHRCRQEFHEYCSNREGGYECIIRKPRCPPGFEFSIRTNQCVDIDECATGNYTCDPRGELCVNLPGRYKCERYWFSNQKPRQKPACPSGYKYNSELRRCSDVDECSEKLDSCGDGEICYNQPGGYSCSRAPRPVPRRPSTPPLPAPADHKCQVGTRYVRNRGCVDVDECKDIPGACSSNENCVNVIGSFSCKCKIGFRRDNLTRACVDINECQLPDNGCLSTQRCDNTVGSYTCVRFLPCGTGYTLNAATEICEDDDECLLGTHDCGEGYNCRNTLGSYRCDKAPRSDRTRPTAALSHKTTTTTTTTMTTTTTPIPRTLPTVSSRLGVSCPHGLELSEEGSYCIDIDECRRQPRICGIMRCTNTIGSYRCAPAVLCSPGYKLDTSGNRCEDIDECSDGSHECGPKQTCENRPGAYLCSCPPGHTLDSVGKNCIDIDECSLYAGKICGYNSKCENTQGSYKCVCEKGFENVDLPGGTACQDIDECKIPGLCQQNCLNLLGGYRCACDRGFRLHSDNRSCTDIDECTEFKNNNLCIGICENTPGSYACKCPDGYKISEDGRICQDIDECESGRVCRGEDDNCQNLRGGFRCNRINCPPGYQKDPQKKNRCVRTSRYCNMGDLACYRIPAHYSYNYISFVSMYPIPSSGQLELFTMRGAHWADSTVQFSMALIDARAPPGVTRATESCFALRKPAPFQAVLVMTKSIQGPQEIELDLSMEIYHNEEFAGSAIAKLFIIVSQYDF